MNRIFISYRASDGKKDADRLCADLSRLYGADQVFFDKQDLKGGTSWRDAITEALGTRPVLLLLLTPELFGMAHPDGGRRIDREDDPIRNELLAARQSGATIVPLLTEGMAMPPTAAVPEALRFLLESHSLKLRTDDWPHDLERLQADLLAHGIAPRRTASLTEPKRGWLQRLQRGLMVTGGVFVALFVIGLLLPQDADEPAPDAPPPHATPPPAPSPVPPPVASAALAGTWWAQQPGDQHRVRVQLALQGSTVQLQSDLVPVAWYPEWQAYAQRLALQGVALHQIRYIAQGQLAGLQLQMPYEVRGADGLGPLDNGQISLNVSSDGQVLDGQVWSNGSQAASPLRLLRQP